LKEAINIIETITILKDIDKCLVLTISADDASFTEEARELIASEEVSKMVKADAFVIIASLNIK